MRQSTLEECLVKVAKESKEENGSQKDNLHFEKGPEVTLRNTGGHAGRTCLTFVVISRRMKSTSQWSGPDTNLSPQPTCRHTASFATAVCCARTLFKPSVVAFTRCLQILNHTTRWLRYGLENDARCVSRDVTPHRLSAYTRDLWSQHASG